ncbi:dihydroneopterin aldolase [Propionibacteriaceae bacterium Y2011]|uniref:dihydroneopterin aldolase n=1 Tax=Microlunatus sp. Y2014 TaxID=3418488 RepID=UPI003B4BD871
MSEYGRGDRITLSGIRAVGHHGVFEHERRDGQEFVVDLVCWVDLSRAAATDDLGETVDYGALAKSVESVIVASPVQLIETLAERIAQQILGHRLVTVVEVTVHKPFAPLPVPFGDVAVTVRRSTSDEQS